MEMASNLSGVRSSGFWKMPSEIIGAIRKDKARKTEPEIRAICTDDVIVSLILFVSSVPRK